MKYQFCKLIGISGLKEGSMFWDYFFCSIEKKLEVVSGINLQ